jgi:hypothetical protein
MHIRIFSAALVLGLIAAVVAVQPAGVPTADAGDLGPGTFVADVVKEFDGVGMRRSRCCSRPRSISRCGKATPCSWSRSRARRAIRCRH